MLTQTSGEQSYGQPRLRAFVEGMQPRNAAICSDRLITEGHK